MVPVKGSKRAGRRTRTTRERVVVAAVEIVDRDGADALTIRRLAEACGLSPMGLYRYVRDRDELLDLVVQHILRELPSSPPARGTWKQKATKLFEGFRRMALRHPGVSALGVERVTPVPAMARFTDQALAIMEEAGLGDDETVRAYDALLMFTIGSILWQVPRTGGERARLLDAAAGDDLPAAHLVRHARALVARNPDHYFAYGLQSLLDGLEAKASARARTRRVRPVRR